MKGARTARGSSKPEADHWRERLAERRSPKWDSFSWVTVKALFESVNDVFAKARPDIIEQRRLRWMAQVRTGGCDCSTNDLGGRSDDDLVISLNQQPPRAFFLIGDTGEQDASQYAAIPLLEGRPNGTGSTYLDPEGEVREPEFMFILSDVIYPAGNINEYFNGFYLPYRNFSKPIYAIPGNHDWYDGLNGFMFNFCGEEPLALERFRQTEVAPTARLSGWLWRGSEEPRRTELAHLRDERLERPLPLEAASSQNGHRAKLNGHKAAQPAPYFAIDLGDLMLVGIDTGVTGTLDDEQGRWLQRVSSIKKQKVLLTGKPICVDNGYRPGKINWKPSAAGEEPEFMTVDDMVREERFGYVAAIGGDIHNYQRYPMELECARGRKRTLHYLVSGGGGAYLSPTHRIPPVGTKDSEDEWPWPDGMTPPRDGDLPDDESERQTFTCYPRRGGSLGFAARSAGPRLFNSVQVICALLVLSAALVLHDIAPSGTLTRSGIFAAYAPLAAAVLAYLIIRGLAKMLAGREEPRRHPVLPQGKCLIAICAAVAVYAFSAWVADKASSESLLVNDRFWVSFGFALAVPIIAVAALLLAHDLRHQIPLSLPAALTAGTAAAALPLLLDLGVSGIPKWLCVAFSVATALALLTGWLVYARAKWLVVYPTGDRLGDAPQPRRRVTLAYLLERAIFVAGPGVLTWALIREGGADWIAYLAAAILVVAAWPFFWTLILGTNEGKPQVDPDSGPWLQVKTASGFLIGVAWIALVLALLSLPSDGWLPRTALGGPAVFIYSFAPFVLLFLAAARRTFVAWLPLIAAVVLLAGALLLLRSGPVDWLLFAGPSAVFLITGLLSAWTLRKGELNEGRAQARVEAVMCGADHLPDLDRRETALFKLLYPYDWSRLRPQGAENTNAAAQVVSRLLAELSDSDRPPFPKHFLRVDLVDAPQDRDEDRQLVIRCFNYTGEEDVADPKAEPFDEVRIPFRSAQLWEEHLRFQEALDDLFVDPDGKSEAAMRNLEGLAMRAGAARRRAWRAISEVRDGLADGSKLRDRLTMLERRLRPPWPQRASSRS